MPTLIGGPVNETGAAVPGSPSAPWSGLPPPSPLQKINTPTARTRAAAAAPASRRRFRERGESAFPTEEGGRGKGTGEAPTATVTPSWFNPSALIPEPLPSIFGGCHSRSIDSISSATARAEDGRPFGSLARRPCTRSAKAVGREGF